MTRERRDSNRTKGLIRIGYGKTKVCVFDLTEDLSLTGVFLRTPYPLDIDTPLQIEIQYTPRGKKDAVSLKLKGRVVRVQNDHDVQGMGVEFLDLTANDTALLKTLLKHLPTVSR